MKLIVGLGNPGRKYRLTRHNIGFICLDYYVNKRNLKFKNDKKFHAECVKTQAFVLLKPNTYMNLSGISVRAAAEYYHIAPEDILVIYDDLDLSVAQLRLRYQGGDGGHKGIRSIMSSVSSEAFKRLRFGIGKHPDIEAKDYVLSHFHKIETEALSTAINTVVEIIDRFIDGEDFLQIMNKYN